MKSNEEEIKESVELEEELRLWASYRGQTLTRTGICSFGNLDGYNRFLLLIIF